MKIVYCPQGSRQKCLRGRHHGGCVGGESGGGVLKDCRREETVRSEQGDEEGTKGVSEWRVR